MNRYKVGPISIIINLFLSAVEQHQIQIEQLTTIMQWIRIGLAKASSIKALHFTVKARLFPGYRFT